MRRGYVHVYTGNGKGKTTAMLGLALRAYGAELKVYIGQFLKFGEYNEVKAIRKFLPDIVIEQYGDGYVVGAPITRSHVESTKEGFQKAISALRSCKYDVVMLDEINIAICLSILDIDDVLRMIEEKPEGIELILTGRYASREIMEAADLVSDIRAIKHYFYSGDEEGSARDGIEK